MYWIRGRITTLVVYHGGNVGVLKGPSCMCTLFMLLHLLLVMLQIGSLLLDLCAVCEVLKGGNYKFVPRLSGGVSDLTSADRRHRCFQIYTHPSQNLFKQPVPVGALDVHLQ